MKVLVTGVAGQLGYDVLNELKKNNIEAIGTDILSFEEYQNRSMLVEGIEYIPTDITKEEEVKKLLLENKPDGIIHCAAWTQVDLAEDEDKQEKVYNINVLGTKYISKYAKQIDSKLIYISTDYIFNGQGEKPWHPDCKEFAPLNFYGKSKLEGEKEVCKYLNKFFIVRIAWVFGINGNNFIKTMLKLGKNHEQLKIVNDQIGTPTYTFDLAKLLVEMIESDKYGFYHATNEGGYISWYDFAKKIFDIVSQMGYEEYDEKHLDIQGLTTKEYGISKAVRPFNSRLDKNKLMEKGFKPLPEWQDALKRYLKEEKIIKYIDML